ncbi:MAG: hypothetical protein FD149_807 [Rhodospirillaceae bacterium]|nr:MAG: hypothetical protein FD149_807 [Rhodospirillaceae bacterium]
MERAPCRRFTALASSHDDLPPALRAELNRAVRRALRRAWLVVTWERLWRGTWPAVTVCGLFGAIVLLDLLPALPPTGHMAGLVVLAVGFLLALAHAFRTVRVPTPEDLMDRLESGAQGTHRPLSTLSDSLAAGGADWLTRTLWHTHRLRMAVRAGTLTPGGPKPGVPAQEPWGVRAFVILLLAMGLAATRGEEQEIVHRLARAVRPVVVPSLPTASTVTLWLTPPAYTGAHPWLLRTDGPAAPAVPVGSTVLALVLGGREAPVLALGDRLVPFTSIGVDSHRLETTLNEGAGPYPMRLWQGGAERARWTVTVTPDQMPHVAFTQPPEEAGRFRLRLALAADDDYGIVALGALIRRAEEKPFELSLTVPEIPPRSVSSSTLHDLTDHPWAGLPVRVRLFARDARGQTTLSEERTVRLPERVFTHPVARAIAEERRRLWAEPATFDEGLGRLDTIAADLAAQDHDPVVFLGVRIARHRLDANRSEAALAEARALLWHVALRIEEGAIALAGRAVQEAEQAVQAALAGARVAEGAELEDLIERYRQAIEHFVAASSEHRAFPTPWPKDWGIPAEDVTALIGRLRELVQAGAFDAAGRLLARLHAVVQGLPFSHDDRDMRQAHTLLEAITALRGREESLLHDTFRHQNRRPRPRGLMLRQEALLQEMGRLRVMLEEGFSPVPEPFGRAEQAMRKALLQLEHASPTAAVLAQGQAVHALHQGAEAIVRTLAHRLARQGGGALLLPGAQGDSLGLSGSAGRDGTPLPSQSDLHGARKILEELRRRATEYDRPSLERDYLHRLLRQF